MSTLSEIRAGLRRAWEGVLEGLSDIKDNASQAVTRFTHRGDAGSVETWEEQLAAHSLNWGLLPAEVIDDDDEIRVRLEAPGMEPGDFEIAAHERYLVVRGHKQVEREEKRGRVRLTERAYGHFERAVALPCEVEEEQAKARYRRGVLTVILPKSSAARSRRIKVAAG